MRVLITAGGTSEAIDCVRKITNISSGKTAAAISDYFSKKGFDVHFIHSATSQKPLVQPHQCCEYVSFLDLEKSLSLSLKKWEFDLAIHLAAVSDYKVKRVLVDGKPHNPKNKIAFGRDVVIHLTSNRKLLELFKTQKKLFLVAFKLTVGSSHLKRIEAIERLFEQSSADLVVSNRLEDVSEKTYRAQIYLKGALEKRVFSREGLSEAIYKIFKQEKIDVS